MRGGAAKLRQQDHTRGQDVETTQLQNERADACAERAGFWRYLSRLFYRELDEELLECLRGQAVLPLSDDFDADERAFARGSNKMAKYVLAQNPDTLTQSRCDYARVFLGAGSTTDDPVSPFESVYTSEEHLLMQGARDNMFRTLIAAGLALDDDYNMPEDHISFEFQYMAHLLDAEAAACQAGDAQAADAAQEQVRAFFENHIANWVPRFCQAAAQLARTPFYRGLCECTAAWVCLEQRCYADDDAAAEREVA